jgi:hypothetical protein
MQMTLIWDKEVHNKHVRFEVWKAASVKITISWDMITYI